MRAAIAVNAILFVSIAASAQVRARSYNDSIVIAPLYVEYTQVPDAKFASEAQELRRRLGQAPHVMLGFSAFLYFRYDAEPDLQKPIDPAILASTLRDADVMVQRAAANALVVHIAITSGFFHGWNGLREAAVRQDVRNAQWFADGWIGRPEELTNPEVIPRSVWVTPSRYAKDLRSRMQESVEIVARHLAGAMQASPDTLLSISGDGEVELSWERNLGEGAVGRKTQDLLYTDYSPFAIAEFRDSLRYPKYADDLTPATDDNHDGHTFNGDYRQHFATWDLKYFNNSGPVSFATYLALPDKLPVSGDFFKAGGFDAPRSPSAGDPLWKAWLEFRKEMVGNYVLDFAEWMTADPSRTGQSVPTNRYFSHQIPADYLFEQPDNIRLYTSASPLETAFIRPFGGAGVTAYNLFNGKRHLRTATPLLLSQLAKQGGNWAILEYNPSAPDRPGLAPSDNLNYYLEQLWLLYSFKPHVIVPFPWTDLPEHKQAAIKDMPFERALARFIKEIGNKPWAPPAR